MSEAICFDRVAKAKSILKEGISNTDFYAKYNIQTAAWYLINRTTYTKKQATARLKTASADYFRGMPDTYINQSIQEIISNAKESADKHYNNGFEAAITIYQEELDAIEALGHDDTERLAFAFLCIAKMMPYENIYECNSKLYKLAWRYKYDSETRKVVGKQESRRVGGKEPTKRIGRLCQAGIVRYSTRINATNRKTTNKPTASATFTVPILRRGGEIAFIIDKPDEESLVLFYDRYKGYSGLINCEHCGKPALRTGRRQKYCSACADHLSHHPEKRVLCV